MPVLALLETTKLSQEGSASTGELDVIISTVCPLSNSTFNGASTLFTLQPTMLLPRPV
jgi:hypothetical protein